MGNQSGKRRDITQDLDLATSNSAPRRRGSFSIRLKPGSSEKDISFSKTRGRRKSFEFSQGNPLQVPRKEPIQVQGSVQLRPNEKRSSKNVSRQSAPGSLIFRSKENTLRLSNEGNTLAGRGELRGIATSNFATPNPTLDEGAHDGSDEKNVATAKKGDRNLASGRTSTLERLAMKSPAEKPAAEGIPGVKYHRRARSTDSESVGKTERVEVSLPEISPATEPPKAAVSKTGMTVRQAQVLARNRHTVPNDRNVRLYNTAKHNRECVVIDDDICDPQQRWSDGVTVERTWTPASKRKSDPVQNRHMVAKTPITNSNEEKKKHKKKKKKDKSDESSTKKKKRKTSSSTKTDVVDSVDGDAKIFSPPAEPDNTEKLYHNNIVLSNGILSMESMVADSDMKTEPSDIRRQESSDINGNKVPEEMSTLTGSELDVCESSSTLVCAEVHHVDDSRSSPMDVEAINTNNRTTELLDSNSNKVNCDNTELPGVSMEVVPAECVIEPLPRIIVSQEGEDSLEVPMSPSPLTCQPESSAKEVATPEQTDQNRNKTTKSSVSTLKRANQPDLVTNSVPNAKAVQEVARLEALCESRTKELQYAKIQLRHGVQGFDAMSALVRYLTEQLDAFSCPMVTAQLKEAQEQLQKAKLQLDDLTAEKCRMEAETAEMRQKYETEKASLITDHHKQTEELEHKLREEADEAVKKVVEQHSHEVVTLNSFHERTVTNLKAEHSHLIAEQERDHRDEVKQLIKEQERNLAELQKQHESNLEDITMRFENIKVTLHEKVEFLRAECEEMKMREKTYMEKCKLDSDCKVQAALAPFRHLPQEIDSMRAVMEMRNQEIHEIRRQKAECEKRLEELPAARDRIKSLEQKVENLEAIISMKAEYEKTLSEKHQTLLRRLDRESKANKRLSMDNEELTYRLQTPSSPIPINSLDGPMHRSLTHSPPHRDHGDALMRRSLQGPMQTHESGVVMRRTVASSPPKGSGEVVMRRHVPAVASSLAEPPKQRTPSDSESSSDGGTEMPKSTLKRSGTYDLLDTLDDQDLQQSTV